MKEMKITTLSELALDLKINKTKLNYYAWLGLIVPIKEVGKTLVFNREETIKKIDIVPIKEVGKTLVFNREETIKKIELIKTEKNKGLTLKEIATKFNAK
jgi:DNA-binding transcriptional MerR regulator